MTLGLDELAQRLWLQTGVMLLLFAATWALASRLSAVWRQALRAMAWFNACGGVGMLLSSQQGHWAPALTVTLALLLEAGGYLLVWRCGQIHAGLPPARLALRLLTALAVLQALLALALGWGARLQIGLQALLVAWVCLHGGLQVAWHLWRQGLRGRAALLLAAVLPVGLLTLARGLGSLLLGDAVDQHLQLHAGLARVLMAGCFVLNALFVHHVFGGALREAERLAQRDPRTGLHDQHTLLRILRHELAQQQPLALAVLLPQHLDALRRQLGEPAVDEGLAALGRLLRQRLGPGDLLAHLHPLASGPRPAEGAYALAWIGPSAALAPQRLRQLVNGVAAQPGLLPGGAPGFSLDAGLVLHPPAAPPPADAPAAHPATAAPTDTATRLLQQALARAQGLPEGLAGPGRGVGRGVGGEVAGGSGGGGGGRDGGVGGGVGSGHAG